MTFRCVPAFQPLGSADCSAPWVSRVATSLHEFILDEFMCVFIC
jgi:hypothetical protein